MRRIRQAVLLVAVLLVCIALFSGCESAEQIAEEAAVRAEMANEELERAQSSAAKEEGESASETARAHEKQITVSSTPSKTAPSPSEQAASMQLIRSGSPSPEPAKTPTASTKGPAASTSAASAEISPVPSQTPEATPSPAASQTEPLAQGSPEVALSAESESQEVSGSIYVRATSGTDYEMLKIGSQGEPVAALQKYLIELGYLADESTGFYGRQTQAAVEEFQRRNSLVADGVVGNSTWDVLLNANSLPAKD